LAIELKPLKPVTSVRLLRSGQSLAFTAGAQGTVRCVVPELKDYEVILFVQ
jgi:hypothetical protein